MKVSHAVLREYARDGWRERVVTGDAVHEIERWLAMVEARPPQAPGASGKPLAWLCLATCTEYAAQRMRVERSVGLLTDVLRVLDRGITSDELRQLLGIFERHGRPFKGTLVENDENSQP